MDCDADCDVTVGPVTRYPVVSDKPHIFVVGVARSGTTLLRLMLGGHPALFSPPEMVLAPFATMAERRALLQTRFWEKGGLRRTFIELEGLNVAAAKGRVNGLDQASVPDVYRLLESLIGDRRLVDKCPHLCHYPDALDRVATWFPDARFLWIVRNPGSVIRSFNSVNMAEVLLAGSERESIEDMWVHGNSTLRDFLGPLPAERWLRIHYEDMVRAPEPVMRAVSDFLGVDYRESMIQPYQGDRMRSGPKGARAVGDPNTATRSSIEPALADKWLAGFDHRTVGAATHELARDLGYELTDIPLPDITQVSSAMDDLFNVARRIEAGIDLPLDIDNLEGRRYLMRIMAAYVDTFTEYSDPDRPRFHHVIGPTRKIFGDCPDSDCLRARIRLGAGRSYRVTGRIAPGTTYVGIVLHRQGGRLGHHIDDRTLAVDDEGRFTLLLAAQEAPELADPWCTWLQCHGDETEVVVRQYYSDRAREPAMELDIELIGQRPAHGPLRADDYARGLTRAGRMMAGTVERILGAHKMVTSMPIKQFHTLDGERLFPTPDNTYQACWYRFGPDQAFVVHGRLPTARYFSLCLYNTWLESLDYTRHIICLNHSQLRTDADGRFTVVLADCDPGAPNWLDTAGHNAGYVIARSLLLDGEPAPLVGDTVWLSELALAPGIAD